MRTFIAVDFDDGIRRQLGAVQDRLRASCPGLRWVEPAKIHLTLKFLGDIDDGLVEPVGRALDELAAGRRAFEIAVRKAGVFGARGPVRVVWVGIEDATGALARCQAACEGALEPLGVAREGRPFRPHLTLARNRSPRESDRIRRAVEKHAALDAGTQLVSSITFYQSTLTPEGPIYRALSRHRFGDGA